MSRVGKREEKQSNKTFRKLFIVAIFLVAIIFVLKYAYNYVKNDVTNKMNIVINYSNSTTSLKKDIFMENGIVYLSKEDIANFFDPYIYYDEKYDQIITGSETKIAAIVVGEKKMTNNGSTVSISGTVLKKDGTYFIPFSCLDSIYNVKTTYIEKTNTVVIDSLDRKFVVADSNKNNQVKQERTALSRTVDKLEKGENVVVISNSVKNGWVRVRTDNGKLGYVKEDSITNQTTLREDLVKKQKFQGNISLIWDYINPGSTAPSRTGKLQGVNVVSPTFFVMKDEGKGEIIDSVGNSGKAYIKWAHDNGYQVWPSVSNPDRINTTSEIMNDYKLRQVFINNIVSSVVKYNLDGINIDLEYMYAEDKKMFNRFLIELAPRLKEIGAVLSVDVTAPDGSERYSLCYDRHTIGKIADYVVFMAYDQNSGGHEGPTAGYNWIETSLKKFVGTQEEVPSEKIILAVPFYARRWRTTASGEKKNTPISMKYLQTEIPSNATKTWDENLKQYKVEYTRGGTQYRLWLEDEQSIETKLSLVEQYRLAGAAYWQKGQEPDSIWNMISRKLGVE